MTGGIVAGILLLGFIIGIIVREFWKDKDVLFAEDSNFVTGLNKQKEGTHKEYEPDYPVKELLELIIRDGYVKNTVDYGYMFNFNMDGLKYINQRRMNVSYETFYSYGSDIAWLTRSETEWLYEQLESHYRKQKEYETKKQREEVGEWIKQSLGATDRAKEVLNVMMNPYYDVDVSGMRLSERESRWVTEQIIKRSTFPK